MPAFLKRRETILVALNLVLFAVVSIRSPQFASLSSLQDILSDTSILIMVAIAQYMVILTGGIDLSIASIMGLSGMCAAMINAADPGIPIPVVVLGAVVCGLILGAVNGSLVGFAGITSIIVTLGTISIYRGLVFLISGGQWVSAHQMSDAFKLVPEARFLGISAIVWYMLAVVLVAWIFMSRTKSGREIYALGGNKTAAAYVGVRESKVNFLVFSLGGAIAGFCGFLYVARYAAAQNDTAVGFELNTVAACVIGGVSIAGGVGTVPGVVLGALFLGIINNALPVVNLSPFIQMAIQGIAILLAIVANAGFSGRTKKLGKVA